MACDLNMRVSSLWFILVFLVVDMWGIYSTRGWAFCFRSQEKCDLGSNPKHVWHHSEVFNHASNNHEHTACKILPCGWHWFHVIPERGIYFLCLIICLFAFYSFTLALVSEKISTASQTVLTFSKIAAIKGQTRFQCEFKYFSTLRF